MNEMQRRDLIDYDAVIAIRQLNDIDDDYSYGDDNHDDNDDYDDDHDYL